MYEICVRHGDNSVTVMEVIEGIVAASNMTSWYRMKGQAAFYRPVLSKVA